MIHGCNFRLNVEGKWGKLGFYTPRFADAADSLLAAHVALEDFRHTRKYLELVESSLNGSDDPSELLAEEIEEVHPGTDFGHGPPGLAFYHEDNGEEAESGSEPDDKPPTSR